jgi:hypothetical protein
MVLFNTKDPQFRSRVGQQVMKTLGVKIVNVQPGEIELMIAAVIGHAPYIGRDCHVTQEQ